MPSMELRVASGVCWNWAQLVKAIEQYDERNQMVKLEVQHSFSPGKKCYLWTIYHVPMIEASDE